MKKGNKIWNFIDNNIYSIFFLIITGLALIIRLKLLKIHSSDYDGCLYNWFNTLKDNGGLLGISKDISNYNAPYITILALLTYIPINSLFSIKLVSIIFDYICGFAVALIILELFKNNKNKIKLSLLAYSIVILLPTVFLNSAAWAQCDSIYTAFVLISLLYLIKKKYLGAFIFLGIAFSFKLQTVFILPLYILMYLSEKKINPLYFLVIPITDIAMCLPAICFGKTLKSCIMAYVDQTSTYSYYITLNFPNIYSIFFGSGERLIRTPTSELSSVGVILTMAIFIIIALITYIKKVKFDNNAIIEFGLWSVLIATFFLPQMHDRYLYMGDIICIIYLFINKEKYYIPLTIELISLSCYTCYLFGSTTINISILSIANLILITLYSVYMYKKYYATKSLTS